MDNETNNDEKFAQEFAKLYVNAVEFAKFDVEATQKRIDMWNKIIHSHYELEPMKIFKKSHKEWEKKLNEYDMILFNLYKSLEVSCNDYFELITTSN